MTREEIIEQISKHQEQLIALDAAEIAEIEPSEDTVAKAKTLTPFDDIFFTKMGESPEVDEEIISTILQFPVNIEVRCV